MRSTKYFILFVLFLSHPVLSEKLPDVMRIGILPDTEYTNILKTYIVHSYSNLGIKVQFIESTPKRGAAEIEKGNFDALIIRLSIFENITENIVKVPFVLATGYLVLYCKMHIICDESVLDDPLSIVGILSGKNVMSIYMRDYEATIYEVESSLQLSQMLKANRLDYILSFEVDGFGDYAELNTEGLTSYKLKKFEAFHYLHERWAHLAPQISKSFELTMDKLGPPKREN